MRYSMCRWKWTNFPGAEGRAGRKVLKVAPNLAVEVTGLAVRKADLVK